MARQLVTVGYNPLIAVVFPQPRHLPLGILPRVDFDLLHGLFKGALPVKIGEEFLVTYSI